MKLSDELKNFSEFSNIKLRVEGNKLHAKFEKAEVEFVIKTLKILLAKENPNMLIESEYIKTFAGKTSVTISFRTIPGDTNGGYKLYAASCIFAKGLSCSCIISEKR